MAAGFIERICLMADPVTAGLIIAGVGAGASAYSQYQAGKEEKKLRKQNAAILAREAEREKEVAGEQAREKRIEGQRLRKRQNVLYAKSGVKAGTGTPLLVRNETVRRIEQQARIIQEHGEFAYSTGMSRAALERKKGRAAKKRGMFQAGSTLATGLGTSLIAVGPDWPGSK